MELQQESIYGLGEGLRANTYRPFCNSGSLARGRSLSALLFEQVNISKKSVSAVVLTTAPNRFVIRRATRCWESQFSGKTSKLTTSNCDSLPSFMKKGVW